MPLFQDVIMTSNFEILDDMRSSALHNLQRRMNNEEVFKSNLIYIWLWKEDLLMELHNSINANPTSFSYLTYQK